MADLDVRQPARGRADLGDDFLPKPWPKYIGRWPRLTGRQEPEFWSGFEGDETDGDVAANLGFEFGARCMPWQWWALRKTLSRLPADDDGIRLWTHPDVVLAIPRQNGKTQIAILRILFGLFVLGETQIYSAQRWLTAEDVYDRLIEIIEASPWLKSRLQPKVGLPLGYSKAGERGEIQLRNGGSIRIGLRSGDLGRGLTKLDLVIFDEAYKLTEEQKSALTGAQKASENAQTIYLSTPPIIAIHPRCHVFAGLRRLGLRNAPDMFFAEWMAPRSMSRDDPDAARMANPSHGVIHKQRDMDSELRTATSPAALALFDADYMGWGDYPPDELDKVPLISLKAWRDMTDKAPVLVGDRVIAISRSWDRQLWAIAAGQRTAGGKIHVEVGYFRKASLPQVALFLAILIEMWDPAAVIVDSKNPANVLVARMAELGFEILEASTPQAAKAAGGFLDAALSAELSHVGQPILETAVQNAEKRDLPMGDFVWNTKDAQNPQLDAISLLHWGVQTFAEELGESASPAVSQDVVDLDEFDVLERAF